MTDQLVITRKADTLVVATDIFFGATRPRHRFIKLKKIEEDAIEPEIVLLEFKTTFAQTVESMIKKFPEAAVVIAVLEMPFGLQVSHEHRFQTLTSAGAQYIIKPRESVEAFLDAFMLGQGKSI